jgi:hypothetical protein
VAPRTHLKARVADRLVHEASEAAARKRLPLDSLGCCADGTTWEPASLASAHVRSIQRAEALVRRAELVLRAELRLRVVAGRLCVLPFWLDDWLDEPPAV